MRFVVPSVLLLVAAIHALPILGVLGAAKLSQLYGITVQDPNLELLLRHRAVLFGLLAALLAYAALRPELHRLALLAGFASVGSFLFLAQPTGGLNSSLITVVRADWLALVLLAIGTATHLRHVGDASYLDPAGTTAVNNAGVDQAGRDDAGDALGQR